MPQPIDVSPSSSPPASYSLPSVFVGSPEALDSSAQFLNPSRPPFSRSRPSQPTSVNTFLSDPSGHASHRLQQEPSWTLFGQLMGEEYNTRPTSPSAPRNLNADPLDLPQHRRLSFASIRPSSPDTEAAESRSVSGHERAGRWFQTPLTPLYRNILKCAIAYFIASLFTFSPFLSKLISTIGFNEPANTDPFPSAHLVATIAVYFNPAKTMGAMFEADLFCFFGLIYSAVVCLGSMSMFWWLELQPGWEWFGDVIAVLWIAVSMSLLAWLKVWMANPSFNTACSMTAILIFLVLVKEAGWEMLVHVGLIILCGATISNLVCLLVWPQSAIFNLLLNMTNTLDSFSTLLPMLTGTFLLENGDHQDVEGIRRAIESHQNSFTLLQKNLNESKSEWLFRRAGLARTNAGTNYTHRDLTGQQAYEDAVGSVNRLGQHLNGLRSGTMPQRDILKAGALSPQVERANGPGGTSRVGVFEELVDELGPPLRSLSSAASVTLVRLREICLESRVRKRGTSSVQPHEFAELIDGIEAALIRFESTSNHAVVRLYRRSELQEDTMSQSSRRSHMGPNALLTENDNEDVFVVYYFIFTLQEFAKELIHLVDSIERIYCYEQGLVHRTSWVSDAAVTIQRRITNLFRRNNRGRNVNSGLRRSLSAYMIPQHRVPPPFPKIQPHAPDTIQTPARDQLSPWGRLQQSIWIIGERLTQRDARYAIKAGVATALLASAAFIESTRPTFVAYWGDWALISFFVVISPTIGATNHVSLQRFLGTLSGALVAMSLYTLFPDEAVILSISGFLFSLPCFYFAIATPQYLSASRFVLLTYNLTCLYCYNLRRKDVSVIEIGFHRSIAVTAGIVWAAFVSRFWWPSEARRELTKSLSEFCLHIGWLYTRLVAFNSYSPEGRSTRLESRTATEGTNDDNQGASSTLDASSVHEFLAMELHLQIKLIELQTLLSQAQHEPRLKGPFPVELYRNVLTRLQSILDRLHSMRCVTTRSEWHTASQLSVRKDFIIPVNKERREMVGNIVLSFFTLASAFRLKSPLPPYLPPAERSRLRLVEAIRQLDVVKNRNVKASRQLLFFAYALTMKGVTVELESLGRTLQDAFGVIGQRPEEFDQLFLPAGIQQDILEQFA